MTSYQKVLGWRKSTKQRAVKAFDGKCTCCGYDKCYAVLEFHHVNPNEKNKDFKFSNCQSWEKIVEEIRKCICVCANCHREIHARVRNIPKNPIRFNEKFVDYKAIEKLENMNDCPVCGKSKHKSQNTCSIECAATLRPKVDWSKFDLVNMYYTQRMSFVRMSELIGVSNVAIKKRMKKEGLI